MTVRLARVDDAAALARLHAQRITDGFLPRLGPVFLTALYRRVIASPDAFAVVADADGTVVGFVAVALDVRALYRRFIVRDGPILVWRCARPLVREARGVLETLRYPARGGREVRGSGESTASAPASAPVEARATPDARRLPGAEVLAVAVDAEAGGQGWGSRLLAAASEEWSTREAEAVKVVVGADNARAIRLYRRAGFAEDSCIRVHADVESEVLVWRRSR